MSRVQVVHDTVRRAIVVGDIHGCLAQLQQLLREARFSNAATRETPALLTAATVPPPPSPASVSPASSSTDDDLCVFVGDLVNKGPDSFGVVRLLRAIGAAGVLGNHDVKLVLLADKVRSGAPLLPKEEASSLLPLARACPPDVLEYLHTLPHALLLPQFSSVVVHAGIDPTVPLAEQDPEALTRMRVLAKPGDYEKAAAKAEAKGKEKLVVLATSKKYVALEAGKTDHKWAYVWNKRVKQCGEKGGCLPAYADMTAIFGHDAKARLQEYDYAVGLDTGCVYGGALTALVLPERKLISVRGYVEDTITSKV